MSVEFTDNSVKVKAAMKDALNRWLYESAAELESQVKQNTAVDTGQLKGSWDFSVDESKGEAVIGSPLENSIWEEFGTGEYAMNGDGRKGGWYYVDSKGKGHFTKGKKPRRALHKAFHAKKALIIIKRNKVIERKANI